MSRIRWEAPTVGIAQPSVASATVRSTPPATSSPARRRSAATTTSVQRHVGDVRDVVERGRALGGQPGGRPLDDEHGRCTVAVLVRRSRRPRSRRHGRRRRRGGPAVSRHPPSVATAVTVSAPSARAPVIDPAATPSSHRACSAASPQWAIDRRRTEWSWRRTERDRSPGRAPRAGSTARPTSCRDHRASSAIASAGQYSSTIVAHHPDGSVPSSITERTNDGEHSLSTMPRTVVLQLGLVVIEFEIHAGLRLSHAVGRVGFDVGGNLVAPR